MVQGLEVLRPVVPPPVALRSAPVVSGTGIGTLLTNNALGAYFAPRGLTPYDHSTLDTSPYMVDRVLSIAESVATRAGDERALVAVRLRRDLLLLHRNGLFGDLDLAVIKEQTGFNPQDVATLLLSRTDGERSDVIQDLESLSAHQNGFLRDTQNKEAYDQYVQALLRLLYGSNDHVQIKHNSFTQKISEVGTDLSWTREKPKDKPRLYYQLYVDLKAGSFNNLRSQLQYLRETGITNVWILPPFESSGIDAGFDPKDRRKIDPKLGSNQDFINFAREAKEQYGIELMVDMVLNHTSWEHERFQRALEGDKESMDFYHFVDPPDPDNVNVRPEEHFPAWKIFEGMVMPKSGNEIFERDAGTAKESNWTQVIMNDGTRKYVYTRFKPQMPDLNYGNPAVLFEELDITAHWADATAGAVSEFRHDAVAHTWKMDRSGIGSEQFRDDETAIHVVEEYKQDHLPQVHLIERITAAFMKHRYNGHVRLIPEIWAPPETQIRYFAGEGVEASGQFGFDLTHWLQMALMKGEAHHVRKAVNYLTQLKKYEKYITFLRHHDGMSGGDTMGISTGQWNAMLQVLTFPPDMDKFVAEYKLDRKKGLSFEGGIATRLYDLMEAVQIVSEGTNDEKARRRVVQAFEILSFLADTPMIYMGDEVGARNDFNHLQNMADKNGGVDMRDVSRNMPRHDKVLKQLDDPESPTRQIYNGIQKALSIRHNKLIQQGKLNNVILGECKEGDETSVITALRQGDDLPPVLFVSNIVDKQSIVNVEVEAVVELDSLVDLDGQRVDPIKFEYRYESGKVILCISLDPLQTLYITSKVT